MHTLLLSRLVAVILWAAPLGADSFRDQIVAQERAELDSLKTGDMTAFANLLADDAVFVDARGADGKAEG